jgi:preprotein translocase subunit SecE
MARQDQQPPLFERIKLFFEEVRSEMAKVAWPSKDEIKQQTSVVLVMLGILAVIIGVMDLLFRTVMMGLLQLA